MGSPAPRALGGEHYCFGCSLNNRYGLRLRFELDRGAGGRARAVFRLPRRFEGPPRAAHGGVVAALLDEAMSKVNAARGVKALTAGLRIRFHRLVPLGRPVTVEAWHRRTSGRDEHVEARIRDDAGRLLAAGSARFVRVREAWLDALRATKPRATKSRATKPRATKPRATKSRAARPRATKPRARSAPGPRRENRRAR